MNSVRHVLTILAVSNLEKAKQFYDAAFGWGKTVDVPVYVEYELDGGQRIGLYERKSFKLNTNCEPQEYTGGGTTATELYFYCDDLIEQIKHIRNAGGEELSALKMRDWGDEAAYFKDPSGNVIVMARTIG